ncbi:MAG TPA: hypothetical protein VLE99_05845 [Candidatus Saccharimonadales bacterium]|nr:hypothetical protein [Candidatus Saccharimonadales bacterium]
MFSQVHDKPLKTSVGKRVRHVSTTERSQVFTRFVGKLDLLPQQQSRLSLGMFSSDRPAKGFSIGLSPEPDYEDSLVTQVLSIGGEKRHELILQIANYGNRKISAEIWQI